MCYIIWVKIFRLSGLTLGNFEHFMPLKSAEQPPWEVISMRVTIVATSPLVITVAATDIVPSVKEKTEKIGYKLEKRNSYRCLIFTWYLLCPIVSMLWRYTTQNWCLVFCLRPFGKP